MNRKARRAAKARGHGAGLPVAAPERLLGARTQSSLSGLTAAQQRAPGLIDAARSHLDRGNAHLARGRHSEAIASYVHAIELQPDLMDAHHNLSAVLLAQGQFDAVARHFENVVAFKPDYAGGYITLAVAYLGAGDPLRALEAVRRALAIKETPQGKSLFVRILRNLPSLPAADDLQGLLLRALSEPWGRPSDLVRHCVNQIKRDKEIEGAVERAAKAWPARLPAEQLFSHGGLRAAAANPLLCHLLESAAIDDLATERFLTSARLILLEAATAAATEPVEADELAFHCALGRQCFVNEYVFACTEAELARADSLRASMEAALHAGDAIPALWPVAVAAYMPLHSLAEPERLLSHDWPQPLDALLVQQVREPAAERALRDAIPRLTPVDEAVSTRVRQQYEENPYPRWVKAAPVSGAVSIDARLRGQFPFAKFRSLERKDGIDMLVAGCGTGQQLVETAQRFAGARVLAIDLSLASLCYAKRQTDALGLANVEYGQADILELGTLGRSFDVIDCGGVLHHLGDPEGGWRVLLSLLRSDGLMRIGLYSDLARQDVVAARAFAAKRSYGRSAEDIRRFRQDVLALPDGDPVKAIARSPDFYSISGCRDLALHVQEHRFTLSRISAFLLENRLEFLGFEIDSAVLSRYGARFPHDHGRTNLDHWDAFEQDNQHIFGGMYQFWVQKAT